MAETDRRIGHATGDADRVQRLHPTSGAGRFTRAGVCRSSVHPVLARRKLDLEGTVASGDRAGRVQQPFVHLIRRCALECHADSSSGRTITEKRPAGDVEDAEVEVQTLGFGVDQDRLFELRLSSEAYAGCLSFGRHPSQTRGQTFNRVAAVGGRDGVPVGDADVHTRQPDASLGHTTEQPPLADAQFM